MWTMTKAATHDATKNGVQCIQSSKFQITLFLPNCRKLFNSNVKLQKNFNSKFLIAEGGPNTEPLKLLVGDSLLGTHFPFSQVFVSSLQCWVPLPVTLVSHSALFSFLFFSAAFFFNGCNCFWACQQHVRRLVVCALWLLLALVWEEGPSLQNWLSFLVLVKMTETEKLFKLYKFTWSIKGGNVKSQPSERLNVLKVSQ